MEQAAAYRSRRRMRLDDLPHTEREEQYQELVRRQEERKAKANARSREWIAKQQASTEKAAT